MFCLIDLLVRTVTLRLTMENGELVRAFLVVFQCGGLVFLGRSVGV